MNTVDFEATKPETFVGKTLPELVTDLYPNIELNIIAKYKDVDVMADLSKSAKKYPEVVTLPIATVDVVPRETYKDPEVKDNFVKYDIVVTFDDAKK